MTATSWFLDTFVDERQPKPSPDRVLDRILNPYEDISYRVPFMFTSDLRSQKNVPPVRMKVNPQSVTFSQSKRITRRDTQSGAVFFHWTNAKGSNNDVINIAFSGQTGNINLRTGAKRANALSSELAQFQDWVKSVTKQEGLEIATISGAAHLMSFWNLYALTREPMFDPVSGQPNQFHVMYSSPILGNAMVDFVGHFDRVLEFSDEAAEPFNKSYNFSFVASASIPSMDDIYKYLSLSLGRQFFDELD
jgi:hypothetical protein